MNNGAECREIRPILKAIDPLFDISFNYDEETYSVYFNGYFFINVPWKSFDRATVADIKYKYWLNVNGDPLKEIIKNNARIEKSKEREKEILLDDISKDAYKAIQHDI